MSGKFTADQAAIFNAVRAAQEAVMDMVRTCVLLWKFIVTACRFVLVSLGWIVIVLLKFRS